MWTRPPPRLDAPVVLAAVAGAHGVRGEVRLKLFASGMELLETLGTLDVDGAPRRLAGWRQGPQGVLARFDGLSSRDAAEALRGRLVTVHRDRLPPPAEGEFYWHDLEGLDVLAGDGRRVGCVRGVENYGASDLVDVALDGGGAMLVPLTADAVAELGPRIVLADPWVP